MAELALTHKQRKMLSAWLFLIGREDYSILEARELSLVLRDSALYFNLRGPSGELMCKWTNSSVGFFEVEMPDGKKKGAHYSEWVFVSDVRVVNIRREP